MPTPFLGMGQAIFLIADGIHAERSEPGAPRGSEKRAPHSAGGAPSRALFSGAAPDQLTAPRVAAGRVARLQVLQVEAMTPALIGTHEPGGWVTRLRFGQQVAQPPGVR
jgi:hypothetical protein